VSLLEARRVPEVLVEEIGQFHVMFLIVFKFERASRDPPLDILENPLGRAVIRRSG
jgi:hypothetical protein